MHELPVVQSILNSVLRSVEKENVKRILSVNLAIGEFHDLIPEWVEKYFIFASRGTLAEGTVLHIERIPVILRCDSCMEHFTVSVKETDIVKCPCCGHNQASIVTGKELVISKIEVEV